jgi:3-oxoacyl-[acyl-carrier protein] reductase
LAKPIEDIMAGKLAAKVAMVTGAGHGIGAAIATRLAADGASVLVCDIDLDRAAGVVQTIATAGAAAAPHRVDVRDRAQADAAVAQAVSQFGGLDILVNNAGIMDRAPFLEMTDDLWQRVIGTNLYGTFVCAQAAARQMVAQGRGGRVVNIASNSGIFGGRGRAAYGASKAGIINLTQTMAIELAEHGIHVNAVAPGPTKSRPEQGDKPGPSILARMPLRRFGTPEEIAAVVAFLVSDEASFTTGHVYAADGGFTITGIMEG